MRERAISSSPSARRYARKVEVMRAMEAVKSAGMTVAAVELAADGTIRLKSSIVADPEAMSEFERWDAAGRL